MKEMKIKENEYNEIKLTIYKHNNSLVIENQNNTNQCFYISSINDDENLNDLNFVIDIETNNVDKIDDDLYKITT
ncbi:MAG: hypothetical protein VW443_13070 [Pseudomonadales bacterium]